MSTEARPSMTAPGPTLVTPVCPLCGSDQRRVVHQSTLVGADSVAGYSYDIHVEGHHPICRCATCGVIYTCPRDSDESLAAMYEAGDATSYLKLIEAKRISFRREAQLIGKRCGAEGALLEIGCAAGTFLEELERVGFRSHGCDPWEQAAAVAKERFGPQVRVGPFDVEDYEPESFRVVVLWSVIEHVPRPLELIRDVERLLEPGGWVALCTPNYEDLSRRILRSRWHLFERPHLTFFDPRTISVLLGRCGFRDVQVRTNYRTYPLSYFAAYLAKWSAAASALAGDACSRLPGDGPMLSLPSGSMSVYARKLGR